MSAELMFRHPVCCLQEPRRFEANVTEQLQEMPPAFGLIPECKVSEMFNTGDYTRFCISKSTLNLLSDFEYMKTINTMTRQR